jgi:hypothetical protein
MRRILITLLPAAALSLAVPAFAQTVYTPTGGTYPDGGGVTMPSDTYTPAPGGAIPGPMTIVAAPLGFLGGFAGNARSNCGVIHNFNGQYTAVCGP